MVIGVNGLPGAHAARLVTVALKPEPASATIQHLGLAVPIVLAVLLNHKPATPTAVLQLWLWLEDLVLMKAMSMHLIQ